MVTFRSDFLLFLTALIFQGRPCSGGLSCTTSVWNLETLTCVAVGTRNNHIRNNDRRSGSADTISLRTFQNFDWSRIKTFQLKDAKLLSITPDLFEKASGLINLDLSGNPDLCFTGGEFRKLRNLQTLRLSGTGKCTGTDLLSDVPNLYSLDLSNLRAQPNDIFSLRNLNSFSGLQIVDLSRNYDIDFTQFSVGGIVKSLNASFTAVKLGDGCFQSATELKTLLMSHSQVRDLPSNTFQGTTITHLDLSYNEINEEDLSSLTDTMSYVNLSHNKIGEIFRPGIFKRDLEVLDLSYNNISGLIVQSFDLTSKLSTLILSHNQIQWMYEKLLAEMPTIIELDLSYNLLQTFFDTFFTDLTNMESLNLAGNLLKALDNALFRNNANLKNLYLQDNMLESLNILTFFPMKKLRYLDLRNNRLTRLPEDLLQIGDLRFLALSCNRLTYLHASFFKGKLGTAVLLQGNPWKCACLTPIISALEVYELRLDREYFNDGNYPTCYVGDAYSDLCDDNTLADQDYLAWEQAVYASGIKC